MIKHIVKRRLFAQAGDLNEEDRHFEFLLGLGANADDSEESLEPNKAVLNLLFNVLEQKGDSNECI